MKLILSEIRPEFRSFTIRMKNSKDTESADQFLEKLSAWPEPIEFVNPIMEHSWGQRVVRLYDPDGHMIEVGESMDYVVRRFLASGMSVEEAAAKTQMAALDVEMIAGSVK